MNAFSQYVKERQKVDQSYDPYGGVNIQPFVDDLVSGVKNAWYNLTGQTEKTSAFKAAMEREDTAYQRAAADMEAAGLSKYQGVSAASSSGPEKSDPIQYVSALLDLKAKQSQIKHVDAETADINAATALKNNDLQTYEERFAADMAEKHERILLTGAQRKLAETQGQFEAEKITAEIQEKLEHAKLYIQQQDLAYQEARNFERNQKIQEQQVRKTRAEADISEKELENWDTRFHEEMRKLSQDISYSVAQENHLGKQDELLVQDLVYRLLQVDQLTYDLKYSKDNLLRTSDPVSRFMGINVQQAGDKFLNNLSTFLLPNGFNWSDGTPIYLPLQI